ncbi:MAG: zinc ribbon domain-containing protein [Clostridiales bacterium]|nr:zinc ribbon domain-containing protein [Clostridiales bacterium]
MRQCPNCHAELNDTDKFCCYCGFQFPQAEPAPVTGEQPQNPQADAAPVGQQYPQGQVLFPQQQYPQQQVPSQYPPQVPQQYPQQPMVAPSYAPNMINGQPSPDTTGVRVIMLILMLVVAAVPFFPMFKAFGEDVSSFDLLKWVANVSDTVRKLGVKSEEIGGVAIFVYVATVFFALGIVATIAGIADISGSNKKVEKFWANLSGGALGVLMGNFMILIAVLALKGSEKSLFHGAFEVSGGFYLAQFGIFVFFLIARIYFSRWMKLNKQLTMAGYNVK